MDSPDALSLTSVPKAGSLFVAVVIWSIFPIAVQTSSASSHPKTLPLSEGEAATEKTPSRNEHF